MSSKSANRNSAKNPQPMTAQQKDEFIKTQLNFWRKLLSIEPKLKIRLKYQNNRDDEEEKWAAISRDLMEYRNATLEIYDAVFTAADFKKEADSTLCHEILHLVLHPLVAYCYNMFSGDEGKQRELERLEEQVVTTLEEAFMEVKK